MEEYTSKIDAQEVKRRKRSTLPHEEELADKDAGGCLKACGTGCRYTGKTQSKKETVESFGIAPSLEKIQSLLSLCK